LGSDFTGLVVLDPDTGEKLFDRWGDKYFVPASNTKLLTFYAALKILGDTIPAFYYRQTPDSLIIWGSGCPLFLHHYFPPNNSLDFLINAPGKLYLSMANFHDTPFGPGWSWDDMAYYYSPERSSFPIYGNTVLVSALNDSLRVSPKVLSPLLFREYSPDSSVWRFQREPFRPVIHYTKGDITDTVEREIPFHVSRDIVKILLEDTLKREVQIANIPIRDANVFHVYGADSLYRKMLQESDNFLAEQILLMCSGRISDSLSQKIVIKYMMNTYLPDLPDPPIWVDGSGLSRYTLISPMDMVIILKRIYDSIGERGIKNIFPAGGVSGTIRNYYKMDPPYIYAKTGTLSGVNTLSGFLFARSGKMLIFSFMNNNYRGSSIPFKAEMDKVLRVLYFKY